MFIKRDVYLQRLIGLENNGLIKIVTGLRRCGKSFLLFDLFYPYLLEKGVDEDHIIHIQLDNEDFNELRNAKSLYTFINDKIKDNNNYYVIIDEIQIVDNFENILNNLLCKKNVDIYVTGSNSRFLSKDIVSEFSGRCSELHILPLSFSEFYSSYDGSLDNAWTEYCTYGGLPFVLSIKNSGDKINYIQSLFTLTYCRDIAERYPLRHKEEFNELIDIVSSLIGSFINPLKLSIAFKKIKNKKISDMTVLKYLGYLEDTFIISQAKQYSIKGKRYISTPYKYYFEDIGLRNVRINFRQNEEDPIMENIVYNELRYREFSVDVGVVESIERSDEGKRNRKRYAIDFIASKGQQKYYIQSVLSMDTPEKCARVKEPFLKVNDYFKRVIIVGGNSKPWVTEEGIVVVGIQHFLLNDDVLV